jgi:hypothetical protein
MDKTKFFFSSLSFSPWAVLATWLHIRALQKIYEMNLKLILNKNSPCTHMKLEFDMLDVAKKFVEYIVHLSEGKN